MKILFIACLSPKTGNNTTAERIREYIESVGHTCELRDAAEFQSSAEVAQLLSRDPLFDGALAVHLFKAGRLLLDIQIPFGIIFGGTDINEDVKVEQKRLVMEQVLQKARFAVAFTEKMRETSELFLFSQRCKVYVQPQGMLSQRSLLLCIPDLPVHTDGDCSKILLDRVLKVHRLLLKLCEGSGCVVFLCGPLLRWHTKGLPLENMKEAKAPSCLTEDSDLCSALDVSTARVDELRVFLLVCGLRRVKDPLYLVQVFSEWHCQDPLNVLIIIGPKIDPVFSSEVESVIKRTAGVYMAQERSQRELHAAMKKCFVVVNSSVSEGMSAAILEAMHLGVPVVARDIPGNAAIVEHGITGLLYSSPQDFVDQSQRLLSDHELRERLVRNGKVYVEEHHNLKQERETYQRLVATLH